ncbi:hypothetical protein SRHO_G00076390 [Serrasalmus rhombeus]
MNVHLQAADPGSTRKWSARLFFHPARPVLEENRKQNVKDVQEEINNLYNNVRLFEKGTKLFSDDTQLLLMKHLLRTICTDLTNILINFLSADLMMATENPSSITAEVRTKILAKLPEETKAPLMKLNNSLTGKVGFSSAFSLRG